MDIGYFNFNQYSILSLSIKKKWKGKGLAIVFLSRQGPDNSRLYFE